MKKLRFTLNRQWEEAESQEGHQRHETRLKLLFKAVHFLNEHFQIWEKDQDIRWKEEIEKQLMSFLKEAYEILHRVPAQAQEIIDGTPESQGDMMKLIMGSISDLRDKVDGLEDMVRSPRR